MLLFLLSLLAPSASAAGIEQIGSGAPGVDAMWSTIRTVFPFADVGAGGVVFVTLKFTAIILSMISAVAVLVIVYAGIKMITTGSDEGFTEAKKIIMYTSMGLIAAMLADVVVLYVISVLNLALA